MTQWLTRDKSDLIIGIDYVKGEVWLYNGGIIGADENAAAWYAQGVLLGSSV